MEIRKIHDLVNRLDSLRKFAKCMNTLMNAGENEMIFQIQKSYSKEEISKMLAEGQNVNGIMELVTGDGQHSYEKAVARLEVNIQDIAPIMIDMIEHCCDKSRQLSCEAREEAEKD